ncbi:MAG: phenylacetate--CoA ligase family protein [Bacteroidia bacterium]|nr:phenylacetate--CoA ligase family protein [Bacteroidia bacterium]NNF30504.1 phenylacetate--CoA ligase family protein [Flavobacteriaceae bacterium]
MSKKIFDKLYRHSPAWFQNIIISTYGYLLFKKRYGKVYRQKFDEFQKRDYTSYQAEVENQNRELREFLSYVNAHSPFYKDLYSGIDISKIKTVEDLNLLPVVDKEMLRANIEDIYTIEVKDAISSFTGGTTGKALKVLFTHEDFQTRMAYLDAFKARLGIDPFKVKKATFSGRSLVYNSKTKIFWRKNFVYRQRLYSTFHLSQDNMPLYISDLNKFKPEVLNGFVSAIYELAEYIEREKVNLTFVPQAIFTTSETLLPVHRKLIEEVFKCKVYDQYASAEGAPFITECVEGNLHYNLDTGIIESDEDNNMIVTSFTTKGTPLVRYNIGDRVIFKEGTCSCGSSHPLVASIEGRKVDFLYTDSGGKISLSHLADVIKGNPNSIIKMQFIQHSKDHIELLIVVDERIYCKEHEDKIRNEMAYRFGNSMRIDMRIVKEIPKEKSGKYALIKNKVKEDSI